MNILKLVLKEMKELGTTGVDSVPNNTLNLAHHVLREPFCRPCFLGECTTNNSNE